MVSTPRASSLSSWELVDRRREKAEIAGVSVSTTTSSPSTGAWRVGPMESKGIFSRARSLAMSPMKPALLDWTKKVPSWGYCSRVVPPAFSTRETAVAKSSAETSASRLTA